MAPKKKSGSSQASQPPPSSRQTRSVSREPEPARQTRGNRKRRLSDAASDASERPASSQGAASAATPSKRRKRGTKAAETEHEILEQVPEVVEEEDELTIANVPANGETTDSIEVSQRSSQKHVQFRSDNFDEIEEELGLTAITPTPHPRLSVKRRVTDGISTKRVSRVYTRHSLPPSLSQEDHVLYREEREFAPLSQVLRDLVVLRRRIDELKTELAKHRESGNAIKVEQIEEELAQLSEVRKAGSFAPGSRDVDMLDDDMLVLANETKRVYETSASQDTRSSADAKEIHGLLTQDSTFSQSQSQSQSRSVEADWATERQNLQNAILRLSEEANTAKTELQILEIEVQGLGFGQQGIDARAVLGSIREAFSRVRLHVQNVLPGLISDNTSSEEIIDILTAKIKEYTHHLKLQDQELASKTALTSDLSAQVSGLLDHLAEAKLRKEALEERFNELDYSNEDKAREVEELQELLEEAESQRDALQSAYEDKVGELETAEEEAGLQATSIDRLNTSLHHYQTEEARLEVLIAEMEKKHNETVANMNREREETVRELEDRMDSQEQLRAQAAQLGEERLLRITELDSEIQSTIAERDTTLQGLEALRMQFNEEQDAREAAEAGLEEKNTQIEQLEARVDRLEEELSAYTEEQQELRQLLTTERQQREAAEQLADERGAEIEERDLRLREQGKQANELRQKLFEFQQDKQAYEQKITDLQVASSERDEQYQDDIAQELERRQAAETLAQDREAEILDLETRIKEIEVQMRDSIAEREDQNEELQDKIAEKDGENEGLRDQLEDMRNQMGADMDRITLEKEDLDASVAVLKETIVEREATITTLTNEAINTTQMHNSEMDDRNTKIAELNHQVAVLDEQVEELQSEKASLEGRVEEEAAGMLELDAAKSDEIAALRATLDQKVEQIEKVEQKVREVQERTEELIAARDEEIAFLKETQTHSEQMIATLESNYEAVQLMFRQYVETTNAKMAELRDDAAARVRKVEQERLDQENEGARVLREMESMAFSTKVTVATSSQHVQGREEQVVSNKKTRGRKKRVMDSGIGLDGEDETMLA